MPPSGERADVQLVDDAVAQVRAAPAAVGPGVPGRVEDPARPVHAVGLPGAARVRTRVAAVDGERVVVPVPSSGSPAGVAHQPSSARSSGHRRPVAGRTRSTAPASGAHTVGRIGQASWSRTSRATGSLSSSGAIGCTPPSTARPVSTSRQRPSGSATVCPAQPPSRSRPTASRVASVTTCGVPPSRPREREQVTGRGGERGVARRRTDERARRCARRTRSAREVTRSFSSARSCGFAPPSSALEALGERRVVDRPAVVGVDERQRGDLGALVDVRRRRAG